MRRSAVISVLILLFVALAHTNAQAQSRPQTREGFFIGFGFGWGSLGCSTCGGTRTSGLAGYLKLGGTLSDQVLLGFETNGWVKSESGVTLSQNNASVVMYFYPNAESGFFIKGGFGGAELRLELSSFGNLSTNGYGLIGGLGYDARVGDNFSLTPYANVLYGGFDHESTSVLQLGLGLTWH